MFIAARIFDSRRRASNRRHSRRVARSARKTSSVGIFPTSSSCAKGHRPVRPSRESNRRQPASYAARIFAAGSRACAVHVNAEFDLTGSRAAPRDNALNQSGSAAPIVSASEIERMPRSAIVSRSFRDLRFVPRIAVRITERHGNVGDHL